MVIYSWLTNNHWLVFLFTTKLGKMQINNSLLYSTLICQLSHFILGAKQLKMGYS